MKKVMFMVMTLALMFTLVGCASRDNGNASTTDAVTQASDANEALTESISYILAMDAPVFKGVIFEDAVDESAMINVDDIDGSINVEIDHIDITTWHDMTTGVTEVWYQAEGDPELYSEELLAELYDAIARKHGNDRIVVHFLYAPESAEFVSAFHNA